MAKQHAHILIVDDDPDIIQSARMTLRQHFAKISTATNPQELPFLIAQEPPEVVLLDMNFTADVTKGSEGLFWLKTILESNPSTSVIMVTAFGEVKLAVEAMKLGAVDFVVKPWDNEKLVATVTAACQLSKSREEVKRLRIHQSRMVEVYKSTDAKIIGTSKAMERVFSLVDKVAPTEANVLILGENGTGKELIAESIHQKSARRNHPFIKVDLGSISSTLFESELFGHKKGAFTDARNDRIGRFELASSGTLFLDEIGNLSPSLQSKLLSVLQNKVVTPVGSNEQIPIDIRLISATNQPIRKMIEAETFREDLLYRLNTVEVVLPPLRDRVEDISSLLHYFITLYSRKYNKPITMEEDIIPYLKKYAWPGNIRELQHLIERAVILCNDGKIKKEDFQLLHLSRTPATEAISITEVERAAIEKAIEKHAGNLSKAAKELGLGRTTLYRKLVKYDIKN